MITYESEKITDYDHLRHTFDLTLLSLDDITRQYYLTLAIFKPTEAIPLAPIYHLWGELKPFEIKQTLQRLTESALLQSQGEEAGPFILPQFYHDFMAEKLGEAGKIHAHQTLLAHYRATCQAEGWHTAPNDGYIYRHLVYHLNILADHDPTADQELHGLFAHDHWLHARLLYDEGQSEGYVADVMTAWQRVQGLAINQPHFIAANVRYALIRTSLNDRSQNYVPELVVRMVETGLWSRSRALAVAEKMSDLEVKAKTLTLLSAINQPHETVTEPENPTSDELLTQPLPAILAFENERHRINALTHFARRMNGEAKEAILNEILRQIWAIDSQWGCVQAVAILAGQLEGEVKETVLSRALELAWLIKATWNRVQALMLLLPHLTAEMKPLVLRELRHFVAVADDEAYQARVLIVLVPHLAAELLTQTLQTTLAIKDTWCRTQVLIALAPYLTGESLALATHSTFVIPDEADRFIALAALMPHLAHDLGETKQTILVQAFHATSAIRDEHEQVKTLIMIALQLSGEAKQAALSFALKLTLAILRSVYRSQILTRLIPHLEGELLSQALRAKERNFTDILREISSYDKNYYHNYYKKELNPQLAIEIMQQILAPKYAYDYELLSYLTPYLADEVKQGVLAQILQAMLKVTYPSYRVEALMSLALHLEGEAKQVALVEAYHAATEIKHPNYRLTALITVAPHLQGAALSQLQAELRATLIAALVHGQGDARSRLLKLLSMKDLFSPVMIGVPTATLAEAIVSHIHEICTEWR